MDSADPPLQASQPDYANHYANTCDLVRTRQNSVTT